MQGLSLRNIKMILKDEENQKKIYDDFGEMLFTHFGVSGPIILSSSSHLLRYKEVESKLKAQVEQTTEAYNNAEEVVDKLTDILIQSISPYQDILSLSQGLTGMDSAAKNVEEFANRIKEGTTTLED